MSIVVRTARQTATMAVIGLLHTSDAHRRTFDALVGEIDPASRTVTVVDETLLARARRTDPSDPMVIDSLRQRLGQLVDRGAESIICTCSTIGGVAESEGARIGIDVVRVDRAMAERAVAVGGRIVVLATLESTVAPTCELIEVSAEAQAASVAVVPMIVVGAWARFEAGDVAAYHALVADAIVRAGDDADVIVLAQASMAPGADRVDLPVPVLSSPRSAVTALLGGA